MFGLYSKRDVEKLVARLRAEYAAALKEQQAAAQAAQNSISFRAVTPRS